MKGCVALKCVFSVVMPVYNKAAVVKRAIESVLSQSYDDFELIIVDDGSTDDSKSVINTFANNQKVKIICQVNQGVSVARNEGILAASGECITFLDPDDRWLENHLQVLYDTYLKCNKMRAIYATGYHIIMADHSEYSMEKEIDFHILCGKQYKICPDLFSIYNHFKYGIIHTNSVMIPKRVFNSVGYFTVGCKRSQDTDMWFRVMLKYPAVIIRDVTAVYYREESTATKTNTRNFNWPFFSTADELISQGDVREDILFSLKLFLDESRISMARHMIMFDQKRNAAGMLKKIYFPKRYIKKLVLTYFLILIPSSAIKKAYFSINKRYYNLK